MLQLLCIIFETLKESPILYGRRTLCSDASLVTTSSACRHPLSASAWTSEQSNIDYIMSADLGGSLCWKQRSWSMEMIHDTPLILLCFSRMFPQHCQQWFWPKMSKIHHRSNRVSFNIGTVCALHVHGIWYSSRSACASLAVSSNVFPLLQPKCQQNIKLWTVPQTLYPFSLCDI